LELANHDACQGSILCEFTGLGATGPIPGGLVGLARPIVFLTTVAEVEHSIDRYLAAMETADRNPSGVTETKAVRLYKKIKILKQQRQCFKAIRLQKTPSGQIP
jgi:hypothetical protein